MELFTQKTDTKLLKLWVCDPLSGKKHTPDPEPRAQDPRSGSATMIKSTVVVEERGPREMGGGGIYSSTPT
jgi:hypothetical protein